MQLHLSVSSLHMSGFNPLDSLSAYNFMTSLNWIRLNAAACTPPRLLLGAFVTGLQQYPAADQASKRTDNCFGRYIPTCWILHHNQTQRLVALLKLKNDEWSYAC